LSTGEVVEHWGTGTLTRRIPTLHRAVPRSYVELHRLDARDLGVRDGDIVRLTSRVGSIEIEARVDHRGQPPRGSAFTPAFDENAPVNVLMPDDACSVSGQIREHGCAVRITRVRSAK
jgi:nitrate reductase NapA